METQNGKKATLSNINFKTDYKVSKYFVDPYKLDLVLPEVSSFKETDLLYLDEIGQMQLFSESFKKAALMFLDSANICIATISKVYNDSFTDNIKKRDDVIIVEISEDNREEKYEFIVLLISKMLKAKKYVTEPERFTFGLNETVIKSEHGIRKVVNNSGKFSCSCDFYGKYGICSHIIAVKDMIGRR